MRARASSLDLDLPIEVDDEYWENDDPELAFRQPEGKPAVVSCFIHWIKLSHIIAYALKTLVCSAIWGSSDVPPDHAPNPHSQYTPSRAKAALGLTGADWKEQTVQKLNDALLKWLEELPPHCKRPVAFANSVLLQQLIAVGYQ